jgi:hypothetical protein
MFRYLCWNDDNWANNRAALIVEATCPQHAAEMLLALTNNPLKMLSVIPDVHNGICTWNIQNGWRFHIRSEPIDAFEGDDAKVLVDALYERIG